MSLPAFRGALVRSPLLKSRTVFRANSTTSQAPNAASEAATKASTAASTAKSKASEGLSRVSSSAGPAISGAAKGVSRALGQIGGRTGRLIAFVESMVPPTIYYARVARELSKIVFQAQKMTPPSVSTFQSYFQRLLHVLRNPQGAIASSASAASSMSPQAFLNQIRNINSQQMIVAGVVAAELIGFFTVGEMLGRMKIVGYRGGKAEHH